MELIYPIGLIICIIIATIIYFKNFNKKNKSYTDGKKVANTKYIKETEYYKTKIQRYKILSALIKIISVISIIITGLLIARPVTIKEGKEEKYNRDIILNIDISWSQWQVNIELIKKFKEIIPSIKGDRIGIVIFNTNPLVYCPVTEDYEYVEKCLDNILTQTQIIAENDGKYPSGQNGYDARILYGGGVIANNSKKGSSLIGDGLAGAVFSFPDLKTDKTRTRVIIFATDNEVSGNETISLNDACTLCNKYNIKLYAYCPTNEINSLVTQASTYDYKTAVLDYAEGEFYNGDLSRDISQIIENVKETKKSIQKTNKKTYITDHPEVAFGNLLISISVLLILEKRIKL